MKLNTECIRDVLVAIEEHQQVYSISGNKVKSDGLDLEQISNHLPKHAVSDIAYTIMILDEAGYLKASTKWAMGGVLMSCTVFRLTYTGHEFLNHIREDTRWNKVRGIINTIGDFSLSAIGAAAEGITTAAISSMLSK